MDKFDPEVLKKRVAEARKKAVERERKQRLRDRLEIAIFFGALALVWVGYVVLWATWIR